MAQSVTSNPRSLSDSEINERHSKQIDLEQQRTKRYSGSHLANNKTTIEYSNNPRKSLVDYEILEDPIPASESFENVTAFEVLPEVSNFIQENIDFQDKFEKSWKNDIGGRIETLDAESSSSITPKSKLMSETNFYEKEQTNSEVLMSNDFSTMRLHQGKGIPIVEGNTEQEKSYMEQGVSKNIAIKTNSEISPKNAIMSPISEVSTKNTFVKPLLEVSKNVISYPIPVRHTNMYSIPETPTKLNFLMPSEDFIGEPRCVALKKYGTDDDMEDALELDFAEFDDDETINEQQPPKTSTKMVQKKNPNDMFLDDDDAIEQKESKSRPYTDLVNPKKDWEKPAVEKEEGELTPDLYSTTLSDGETKKTKTKKDSTQEPKESSREKKPERKESNQDFFLKINRCFRQLEREFCNMHVPRGSRRMIGQLQNTLCNVDRMKRRLTFLIDSGKNTSKDKSKSETNSKDEKHASSRKGSIDENRSKSTKVVSSRSERVNSILRDSVRSNKEADSKINRHIRRTAATIAYAGTRQEKQRIQSLFKRQMSMITQHVIQRNDTGKGQNPKAGGSRSKKTNENIPEAPKAPELQTLDEMEAFLAVLKVQKNQKEDILAKENEKKQQGPLRFTTKKGKPVVEKRMQPVLLVGSSQNIPLDEQVEKIEWQKQVEVLKTMSDKRKEILENKKEYEEVKLLQEQLQKLTNINTIPEPGDDSINLKTNMLRNPKEQSITKSVATKDVGSKEKIQVKEIESKKGPESSSEKVIDSCSVKKNLKEAECIKDSFHPRFLDCEPKSRKVISENCKKRKRKLVKGENSHSETSGSDSDSHSELEDQILKKRKRNESGGKLSSVERHKKFYGYERKSPRSRHRSHTEEATIIDGFDEKLPKELRSKRLLIVGDKNMALLNERFCLKVKGNQIYLKKLGKKTKRAGKGGRREQRNSRMVSNQKIRRDVEKNTIDPEEKPSTHSLQEMEEFLQQLRSKNKKVINEDRDYVSKSNQPSRETKFMARIQAKRKAKLMACVTSATQDITEKEAKFLKDLENRTMDPADSPDTEKKKQKLLQKIREETDAIVLSQKDEDPLSDVKSFLNMLKEADDEKSKQFCVSFSMKRSDVKQLENITTGKASALTEESQKFLNSVRSKMRAKKAFEVGDCPGQKG